jgi:penicillin-binding protein 2
MRTAHEKWYPGETISVGIGQGPVQVTPIALAEMITAVANGGHLVTPHVVKAVDMGGGWRDLTVTPPRALFPIPADVLQPVQDGLWLAVNGNGTATRARVDGYDVSGKTGTAQVISEEGRKQATGKTSLNLKSHAWFEFYAPRTEPEISGVVMAEHGGYGADSAVPIAKFVLDTYFAKKAGKPLPVWPAAAPPPPVPVAAPPSVRPASAGALAP